MSSALLDQLRRETRSRHADLDGMFANGHFGDADGYTRFLLIHAQVLPVVEEQLGARAEIRSMPLWSQRLRAPSLNLDLSDLGAPRPARLDYTLGGSPGAAAGAAYVLEGSRLGGRLISANLGKSGLQGLPTRFIEHGRDNDFWRTFLAWLGCLEPDACSLGEAVGSANEVFDLYLQAARVELAAPGRKACGTPAS